MLFDPAGPHARSAGGEGMLRIAGTSAVRRGALAARSGLRPLALRWPAASFLLLAAACSGQDGAGYRNLDPNVAYVGDAACASCHPQQTATFSLTAMGRSFSETAALLESGRLRIPREGVSFDHEKSRSRYRVFVEGGLLKHAEIRQDEEGNDLFTDTRPISYVLGSGDRGQTFLVGQGDRLYQSPVAFRPHRDGWGMAAGYDRPDHLRFARPVTGPCLFCHAHRARYVEGSVNRYELPPFQGMAIGCERCHGPGGLHVSERKSEYPSRGGIDTSIVNPRRLPPDRRDDVCFQCHLQGGARIRKAGPRLHGFRPGLRLADFFAVFHKRRSGGAGDVPSGEGTIEVVSHVERLRLSRCWERSGGRIHCLTCHDPHRTPRGEEAVVQFRAACLTCHRPEDCDREGMHHAGRADCAGCHMIKRPPSDAPHTVFTDHLIARRPAPEKPGARPERGGRFVLVNFFEGESGSPRDLGAAYLLAAGGEGAGDFAERGAAILEPLLPSLEDDAHALRLLAAHYLGTGRRRKATPLLERLVELAPRAPEYRVELARSLQLMGREEEALVMAREAVREEPDLAPARLALADAYYDTGEYQGAEEQLRASVTLDPALAPAHARLGRIRLMRREVDAAEDAYATALALEPSLMQARLGMAQAHLDQGRTDEALLDLRRAVEETAGERSRVPVRLKLIRVLIAAGRREEALEEIDRVLGVEPGNQEALGLLRRLRTGIARLDGTALGTPPPER